MLIYALLYLPIHYGLVFSITFGVIDRPQPRIVHHHSGPIDSLFLSLLLCIYLVHQYSVFRARIYDMRLHTTLHLSWLLTTFNDTSNYSLPYYEITATLLDLDVNAESHSVVGKHVYPFLYRESTLFCFGFSTIPTYVHSSHCYWCLPPVLISSSIFLSLYPILTSS